MRIAYHAGVLVLLALPPVRLAGQSQTEASKIERLILKDGSYQLIGRYEIRGNHLRYFSTERHAWEEIPSALVDWPATEKFASKSASVSRSRRRKVGEEAASERAAEEAAAPLVAPGIRLPELGGVYLLDRFQGKPGLCRLHQAGADVHKNVGGNILRGVLNPAAGSRQTIELPGLHAAIQAHVGDPKIYIAIDPDDRSSGYTAETARDHFRIVRCDEKKGNRVVGVVHIAVYGKVTERARYIETRVEPVSGRWIKVMPAASLAPGEYALVELLGKQSINTFVWDFGVDPAAAANREAVQTEAAKPSRPPILQKRARRQKP